MMSRHTLSIPAVVCLIAGWLLYPVAGARADFYKYKDSGGNLVITNRLEDVPQKYRQRVKVVWDKNLEDKDPLARRRVEADKIREQQQTRHEQQKPVEKMTENDRKTLVITFDEETGQLLRRFE